MEQTNQTQNNPNNQLNPEEKDQNKNFQNPQNQNEKSKKKSQSQQNINETNIEQLKKLKECIENMDESSLITLLTKETIKESILNKGLCLAVQKYNENMDEIIRLLLIRGASPDCYFHYVDTSPNIIKEIEENDKVTCLMYACFKGKIEIIHLLLKGKHNINLTDKSGKNALFYVLYDKSDNFDIVHYLIKQNINVNCEGKVEGKNGFIVHTPLSYAAANNLKHSFKILLENGANPNYKTYPNEDTILHIAVRNGNLDIVKELINFNDIKLEEKNKEGKTPRDIALNNSQNEIYKILTEKINEVNKIEKESANDLLNEESNNENKKNFKIKEKHLLNIRNDSDNEHKVQEKIQINSNNNNNINFSNNNNLNLINNNNSSYINNNIENMNNKNIEQKPKKKRNIISEFSNLFPNYRNNKNIYLKKPKHCNNLSSSFQIPIKFNTNINKLDTSFNSFISFDTLSTPTLTLDLSQGKINYESKIAKLTKELKDTKDNLQNENNYLKNELEKMKLNGKKLTEKINEQEKKYTELENQNKIQLENYKKENEELKNKITLMQKEYSEIFEKYKILEQNNKNNTNIPINPNNPTQYSLYLNKKFINFTYDQMYVLNCLSKDIKDYQQFVKEHIEREQSLYDTLIQNIQISVDESIHDYDVHLYGSHATNLCLPWSDLDVVLVPRNNNNNNNQNSNINNQILLNQLYENIKKKEWVKESKYISSASIPIIKLICDDTFNNMPIDISIQDERHFGLKCVELVKGFISQYECLKPLVLVLKNILKRANLNDPYKGGISSYGLILMIVTFLQTQKKIGKDISNNENNLGRLFFDFVNHYGLKFEPSKYIIYARTNEDEDSDDFNLQNIQSGNELVIIDPLNPSNNVAKSCFQFFNIKMSLIICIITLKEDCECGCHYTGAGEAYNNLNADHCFLKRIFNSVKRFQI